MISLVRREVIDSAKTVVVKIGTNVLARPDDSLDVERVEHLAGQVHAIRESGRKVVVVSSGAVSAGLGILGLDRRPGDLPHLQAAAATGQAHLIRVYDDCLRRHGLHAAQLLLTANDFKHRSRYLNVRNTLATLFEYGVVPIINENDTVSVDEIKFGDNDQLAAMVTNLVHSPLLVILSNVDGLFDGDPRLAESNLISLVTQWDDTLLQLATEDRSSRGTGGMQSKLRAVRLATAVGENVIIANGRSNNVLLDVLNGREVGTLFAATGSTLPAWKRWIGYTVEPRGKFELDDGACHAVEHRGRSLLAIGVTAVHGHFAKGEVVALADRSGREFARGLSNYDSRDALRIAGKKGPEIVSILGHLPYPEIIHRDNLVITR